MHKIIYNLYVCSDGYNYKGSYIVLQQLIKHKKAKKGKDLGILRYFLGLAHHHVIVQCHAPIQAYANNHMIAELAEPRIGVNVPRPIPSLRASSIIEQAIT
jgi:hypothetical protein